MVFINGFITTLIVYKGTFKEKVKEAGKHFGKALRDRITSYNVCYTKLLRRSYQVVYADTSVADVQNNTSGTETTASSGTTELIAATAEEGSAGTSESTVDDSADTSVDSAADTSAETTDESGVAAVITSYSIHYTKLYEAEELFHRADQYISCESC